MTTKHTPGPWIIGRSADGWPHIGTSRKFGAYGENVALVTRPTLSERMSGAEDFSAANARLIAAAPELLAALFYLLEQTVEQDVKHGIELTEGEEDARSQARAAIAKAEGAK